MFASEVTSPLWFPGSELDLSRVRADLAGGHLAPSTYQNRTAPGCTEAGASPGGAPVGKSPHLGLNYSHLRPYPVINELYLTTDQGLNLGDHRERHLLLDIQITSV